MNYWNIKGGGEGHQGNLSSLSSKIFPERGKNGKRRHREISFRSILVEVSCRESALLAGLLGSETKIGLDSISDLGRKKNFGDRFRFSTIRKDSSFYREQIKTSLDSTRNRFRNLFFRYLTCPDLCFIQGPEFRPNQTRPRCPRSTSKSGLRWTSCRDRWRPATTAASSRPWAPPTEAEPVPSGSTTAPTTPTWPSLETSKKWWVNLYGLNYLSYFISSKRWRLNGRGNWSPSPQTSGYFLDTRLELGLAWLLEDFYCYGVI